MHRLLTLPSLHSLRNRRLNSGKHRLELLRSQSSLQVCGFENLVTMRLEAEDRSFTAKTMVSEKLRKVYTRDFLLSLMKMDTCKDVPCGVDLSGGLWKPKYERDFLLSLTALDACKRLPLRFNYRVHSEIIVDAYGGILGVPSAELSHDSKNSCCGSWSSRWDSCESGRSSDGKSEANTDSDDGKDYQAYFQLAKSSNPYRPPHSSKVEPKEGVDNYVYTKEASNSAGCRSTKRADEDKTGACPLYSWKKELKTLEENQEQRGDKHDPVTVRDSENDEGQKKRAVDLILKADIRHKTDTPALHSQKLAWRSLEEVGGISSICTEGTSEVYRRRKGFVTKPAPTTFSQRDELPSKLMNILSPSADNGAPKQCHVFSEVASTQEVLTCKQLDRSITSNSERNASQHQYRSQPRDLVHTEGNMNTSEYSSSLQKGVVSCQHETQSSSKHFLVKNGSSVPHLSTAGNIGKTWVIKGSIHNEAIPSVQGDSSNRALEPVFLDLFGYQFSAGDDNISTSTADKCESSGIVSGRSKDASSAQVTDSDKRDVVQSAFDDDWAEIVSMIQAVQELQHMANRDAIQSTFDEGWAEIVSMIQAEQELQHRALAEAHQLSVDEICLPDEDSLIAFDERLTPQQPELTPVPVPETQREHEPEFGPVVARDESSLEYCLPDEESLITCDDRLIPQNLSGECSTKHEVMPGDVTVRRSNEPPTKSVVSNGVTGRQGCQQNSLHTGNSESNPRTPSSNVSNSRQPQVHSRAKTMNPNSHRPAPKRHFDAQSCHPGRRYSLPRMETGHGYPVLWPPLVFPHLHHEMLNGPALSTYIAPVPGPLPYSNSLELLPMSHPQPGYEVYRMNTPVPYPGSKYNNRSSGNRFT